MNITRLLCAASAVVLLALAAPALAASPTRVAPDSPGCLVRSAPPDVGASELWRVHVSDRLLELRLHSSAMQGSQGVFVLLPSHYDASGATRYPVLYLLHGALDDYTSWPRNGVAGIVGDLPVIVVMPDDGKDGSYSDWYGMVPGATSPIPSWETYHIDELVPFVDRTFPTVADRSGRFIAGLSSGGSGTMKYVAAHPGMFGAAGSFSGAVDTDLDYPNYPNISEALWGVTALPGYGPDGHCTWGDPYTQHVVWLDNDPTYLAENLKGTPLFLACGNGSPGPYDSSSPGFDPTEYEVSAMNQEFVKALDANGIPHTDEFYGNGTHTWPYWKRDLAHFLTWLKPKLAAPVTAPSAMSLRSARPAFSAWGWQFNAFHDVREFVYLEDVSARGFAVTGSGDLDVVTGALYRPGWDYLVQASGSVPVDAIADAGGRLHLHVGLGPSHDVQQYDFGAGATRQWVHRAVEITPT
jgi:diacylglycerol O-acyltransferase/trehalose O-mycolyltransferase